MPTDYIVIPGPRARRLTPLQFRQRFTFAERVGIDNSTLPEVVTIRADFAAAAYIAPDDLNTVAALNGLVGLGRLTAARAAEILAAP